MPLIVLVGPSGQSRDILDAILAAGRPVSGLLWDGTPVAEMYGVPVVGGLDDWSRHRGDGTEFVVALGDPVQRGRLGAAILAAGASLASVVHPRATVSPCAMVGRGVAIMAGVQVSPAASI